ncbi:hypothetical protein ACHAW5_002696 [Stephanodiscus triporus]|uniref:Sulfhydryl oxidase n=1 Tax=Stephanodiscus triporus TaxID=2934178 RepID=A0ABD3N1E5_9STRA
MPLRRLPTNNYLLGTWIALLFVVAYLAFDGSMGREKYLYHDEDGAISSASDPSSVDAGGWVIEYVAPADGPPSDSGYAAALLRPDFLYAPPSAPDYVPPPRVVEFYAPWCPHCRRFAPEYARLAAEVSGSHPSVKFFAVSCVAHNDLCKAQNVTGYPTIRVFREASYEPRIPKAKDSNAMLRELGFDDGGGGGGGGGEMRAGRLRKVENGHHPRESGRKSSEGEAIAAGVVPFRINDVHDAWSDAALSFEFALGNGIYVENGPLDDGRGGAFREWLVLLSRTLPPQMNRTHEIIDALLGDYPRAAGGQSGLNELVRERVGELGRSWTWRTCTYGDGGVGYTCGLWQLFHVMSLGVVEYNRHYAPMPTRYVSDTLRDYVDNFFQCEVCRMNLLSMYDACAFDGCHRLSKNPSSSEAEWRELPLWLWETHNDVNVRLMGERLERNAENEPNQWEQQARWPSLHDCPNCWRDDRSWEDEEIFKFLRNSYWSGNPSYIRIPSSDGNPVGGSSRMIPLRWKLTVAVFAAVVLILHMYKTKKRKSKRKTVHKWL